MPPLRGYHEDYDDNQFLFRLPGQSQRYEIILTPAITPQSEP